MSVAFIGNGSQLLPDDFEEYGEVPGVFVRKLIKIDRPGAHNVRKPPFRQLVDRSAAPIPQLDTVRHDYRLGGN
jgi:hypothetical protein